MNVNTRREENVRILLRTLHDPYPGPQTLTLGITSGPAPSRRAPCRLCNPSSLQPRKKITACLGCTGDGWRRRTPGEPVYDEYTGRPIATLEEPKKATPMSPERLEAELHRVERGLRLSDGVADPDERFGWEAERERQAKDGSYRELERVLDYMQIHIPTVRSFVNWVYLSGVDVRLTVSSRRVDSTVVGWMSRQMRGRIMVPRRFYLEQLEERKREVRRLTAAGVDVRGVARMVGVSQGFVRSLTEEETK